MAKRQSLSGQDQNATLITDLPAPSGTTDATRKSYVDDADALRVKRIETIPLVSGIAGRKVEGVISRTWGVGSIVGDLVIETGMPFGSWMVRLEIKGYFYVAAADIDLTLSYYALLTSGTTPAYVYCEANNNGTVPITQVRFMKRTSDDTVVIVITNGALSSNWQYPKINIDGMFGHSAPPSDALLSGWDMLITSDLSAYTPMNTAVLSTVSRVGHTHTKANITDLGTIGTAAAKNAPAAGNATGTDVVLASDTRLSDARTPVAHTHNPIDIPLGASKLYVRAATTTNITLSGLQAIDGYTVAANERVLVKDQSSPALNGIYNAATGAWTRAVDANTAPHFYGASVTPYTGAVNAGKTFRVTNWTSGSTLGTSLMTWAQVVDYASGDIRYGSDLPVPLTATPMTAYGDSFAAEFGLTANTGFISQAASALGMTTPMDNNGSSGSAGRAISHLALSVTSYRWAALTSGVVTVHCGLNDAREFDLTNPTNAKWLKAYRNSLRILATLFRGQERVGWSNGTWSFAGTWATGAYNFTSEGTLKSTNVNDSEASIAFVGPEITVILGHAIGSTTVAELSLDGVTMRSVHLEDESSNGSGEGLTIGWAPFRFTGLGEGPHVLKIRKSGGSGGLAVDSYVLPAASAPQVKFVEAAYMDPTQYSLYSPYNNGSNASVDKTRFVMRDVAAEFDGVTVVPATTLTAVTDYQADKVHPNAAGTTKLTATLQASIINRIGITERIADVIASKDGRSALGGFFASKQMVDEGAFNRLAIRTNVLVNPTTMVIDASLGSVEIIQFFVNIGASSVANARDGQDLRIMHYRASTETIVWPTNFRWANNTAPAAITAATRNYYTLNYSSETGLWYECVARVLAVPQA